jgi:hypothetical protein
MAVGPEPTRTAGAFARRVRRVTASGPIQVGSSNGTQLAGDLVDLSTLGVGFRARARMSVGDRVTMSFRAGNQEVQSVSGHVVTSRQEGGHWRIGAEFGALGMELRARVEGCVAALAIRSGRPPSLTRGTMSQLVRPGLRESGPGREILYQAAREHLVDGNFEAARTVAGWAASRDPGNRQYEALLHRIDAEEALARGDREAAASAVARAATLSPRDDEIGALAAMLLGGRPKG